MKDFAEMCIEANKAGIVHNCICHYLWYGTPFSNTIEKSKKHSLEYNYCNPDDIEKAVIEVLHSMTTAEGVSQFISEFKKNFVSPSYKTVKEFIRGEYQKDEITTETIACIVQNQLPLL